jgi:hypothetical protein
MNEYVFDTTSKSGNFYYSWPELTYSPTDWLRVGLVAQRTKPFQSRLDVFQRGFLVGFRISELNSQPIRLNLGWTDPTVVLEVGWNF